MFFFDQLQYVPKTWINRNYIKSENSKLLLTLPVQAEGHLNSKISDIKINNDVPWKKKHLSSIKFSYSKIFLYKFNTSSNPKKGCKNQLGAKTSSIQESGRNSSANGSRY